MTLLDEDILSMSAQAVSRQLATDPVQPYNKYDTRLYNLGAAAPTVGATQQPTNAAGVLAGLSLSFSLSVYPEPLNSVSWKRSTPQPSTQPKVLSHTHTVFSTSQQKI